MRWLIISLLCLAGCSSGRDPAPLQPAQSISWDFESGAFPSVPLATPTLVPGVVLLEGSPHFHYGRLTASPSDCGPSYFTTCPTTRAEDFFNQLTPAIGQSLTYQVDLRLPSSGAAGSNTGSHNLLAWQVVGITTSRSVWIGAKDGRWYIANRLQPCSNESCTTNDPLNGVGNPVQVIDLGAVVYDEWESFRVIILFETDTTGTVQVWKNGTSMGTMTNQPTLISAEAIQIYMNMLDWQGNFGIVDFDNLSMSDVQTPP